LWSLLTKLLLGVNIFKLKREIIKPARESSHIERMFPSDISTPFNFFVVMFILHGSNFRVG